MYYNRYSNKSMARSMVNHRMPIKALWLLSSNYTRMWIGKIFIIHIEIFALVSTYQQSKQYVHRLCTRTFSVTNRSQKANIMFFFFFWYHEKIVCSTARTIFSRKFCSFNLLLVFWALDQHYSKHNMWACIILLLITYVHIILYDDLLFLITIFHNFEQLWSRN